MTKKKLREFLFFVRAEFSLNEDDLILFTGGIHVI
jgi:hypothetical protein